MAINSEIAKIGRIRAGLEIKQVLDGIKDEASTRLFMDVVGNFPLSDDQRKELDDEMSFFRNITDQATTLMHTMSLLEQWCVEREKR